MVSLARGVGLLLGRIAGKRPAFTLAELLVSLAVFTIAASALVSLLITAAQRLDYVVDYRKAALRAAEAEAFLRAPAACCSYAMPLNPELYRTALGGYADAPFNWDGPINVGNTGTPFTGRYDVRIDGVLFIAYTQPGSVKVKNLTVLDAENDVIYLNRAPQPSEFSYGQPGKPSCKQFVCFASAVPPGTVFELAEYRQGASSLRIRRSGSGSASVQKNDEARLFRAMAVYAFNDILYSYDYSESGRQPRLRGIHDLRFQADISARKLTVYIVSRGDKQYAGSAPIKGMDNWPGKYLPDSNINGYNRMLLITKIVLELPNCLPPTFLDGANVAEVF